VSGDNFSIINLEGYTADKSHSWSLSDYDQIRLWKYSKLVSLTTSTSGNSVIQAITFPLAYPIAPPSLAVPNDVTTSSDRLIAYAVGPSTTGVEVRLYTTSGSNFSAAVSRNVSLLVG